ncbi:hypothetical protein TRIATDRAFT_38238, partial [Trichoderma atroviride IMI 206040]
CLRDLRSTDPVDDKKRIQTTKGGLLRDSYAWILTNSAFLQWRDDPKCPLLWIRGNPGKGKTMLLCGIVDEMEKSAVYNLSYFFCQQTDSRINNSVAILRGLIYMLVRKQPSLMPHIRTKYDDVGKAVFEDQNAWVALSQILANILRDPSLKDTILIIDALDECFHGLHQLLDLIMEILSSSTGIKLLVSSRNELDIQKRLEDAKETSSVSLELNSTSVVAAIASYIRHKVQELKFDDEDTQTEVEQYLIKHANGTFLWVALVCDNLKRVPKRVPKLQLRSVLAKFPPGLDHLYERMMEKICDVNAIDLGRQILAVALAVYRPLTILELASLVDFNLGKIEENEQALCEIAEQIPGLCGSFLVLQDQTVYFVHQSAKDYLDNKAPDELFLSKKAHHQILSASLPNMEMTLKKDIYGLEEPGYSVYDIPAMEPDPLAAVRYSCVYWIDHFLDSLPQDELGAESNTPYYKPVEDFLRSTYLYWLEALALLRNIPRGVIIMQKLEKRRKTELGTSIKDLIKDACRFIQEFADAIHDAPLQAYVSALLFSPDSSLIHRLFEKDLPNWVIIGPKLESNWRLRMLEGHQDWVTSIAISCRGNWLASTSEDTTVKIWDTGSGILVRTIVCDEPHKGANFARPFAQGLAALSHDWKQVAITSRSGTINIWDTSSGKRLWQLKESAVDQMALLFSLDGKSLAVICVKPLELGIWDLTSGTRKTTPFQEVTSPESFESFLVMDYEIRQLKGLPDPHKPRTRMFDSVFFDQLLGLPANQSSYSITEGNTWLTHNEKRILWLPPRYRPATWSRWDANDRFIGIYTHQPLLIEFCCNMCSAQVSNTSNKTTTCKQNFIGRYNNLKEAKDISPDKFRTIRELVKDIVS